MRMNRVGVMRAATDGERWNKIRWHEERRILRAHHEGAGVRELASRFRLNPVTIRKILRAAA